MKQKIIQFSEPSERSLPFAGVHPETLQHAAQRLRPTVYRESLLPHEREQFLDGSDQLASGRYWTVIEFDYFLSWRFF